MTKDLEVKKPTGDLVGTAADAGIHQEGSLSRYSTTERDSLRALAGLDEASDGDLDMLGMVSQRTGLDPFLKEIYLVGRKTKVGGYRGEPERWGTKWTVQTGIDGFRKVLFRVAEAQGKPHTISEPTYYTSDGQERSIWLKAWGYPAAARVEVSIGDSKGIGVATWDEYVQTKKDGKPNSMWEKMGPTMLAKCAEAQAHRRVNALTSGMYVAEEMQQADSEPIRATATRVQQGRGASGLRAALEAPQQQPETAGFDVEAARQRISEATSHDTLLDIMAEVDAADLDEETFKALSDKARTRWEQINEEAK